MNTLNFLHRANQARPKAYVQPKPQVQRYLESPIHSTTFSIFLWKLSALINQIWSSPLSNSPNPQTETFPCQLIVNPRCEPSGAHKGQRGVVLTVVASCASVRGHGAVAGEVLPLLNAHAHVGAGVLLTRGAGAWREGTRTENG